MWKLLFINWPCINLLFPNYFFGNQNMAGTLGGAKQQHSLSN